ncbi:DUF695 domain-containing protein [Flexivirga sp. ID2601S]|uniref:DUF695 domain-containing protein n=1 Tax=Flexivirga aerilata TaxID=1656889 RepID=A0A849ALI3_9MICO|nr:DUF695 domain-containing protein [Flexivirga aerilata]NNG41209.1 DUF695 domain-containing protein [Flexivirga aerilata]
MAFFGKRRDDPAAAIDAFWAWWADGGSRTIAMDTAGPETAIELSKRVAAIEEGLAWELARGRESAHLLVVTAAGDPELRAVARRWLRRAPEADLVWSYADSRQPVADLAGHGIEIDDVQVGLDDARVGVRRQGSRVDVTFYHPRLADLREQQRLSISFLALDAALGEEATETWIGELVTSTEPPLDGFGLAGLRAVVRDLREEFTAADGEPQWLVLQGSGPKGPVSAVAQVPLAAAWAPHLDSHIVVAAPYAQKDDNDLPSNGSLTALRRLQDHITDRLEGQGRVVARESSGGTCLLHVYAEGSTPAADQVRAAVAGWPDGKVKVSVEADPGWAGVAHLRG